MLDGYQLIKCPWGLLCNIRYVIYSDSDLRWNGTSVPELEVRILILNKYKRGSGHLSQGRRNAMISCKYWAQACVPFIAEMTHNDSQVSPDTCILDPGSSLYSLQKVRHTHWFYEMGLLTSSRSHPSDANLCALQAQEVGPSADDYPRLWLALHGRPAGYRLHLYVCLAVIFLVETSHLRVHVVQMTQP